MKILQAIFNFFYELLLGCHHEQLTRPFTIQKQTYKVCLECGKHLFYSADTLSPLSAREMRRIAAAQSGELKVMPAAAGVNALNAESQSKAIA